METLIGWALILMLGMGAITLLGFVLNVLFMLVFGLVGVVAAWRDR